MSKKGVKKVSSGKRSISKKQNNSKKQKEALPYKNVVIPFALAVVAVVVFLLVILIKQPTAFEEGVPTAGKAVSSNLETSTTIVLNNLPEGTLAISPSSADAGMQYDGNNWVTQEVFTVDVVGNPDITETSLSDPLFNNYGFTVNFDSSKLEYVGVTNEINGGWKLDKEDKSTPGQVIIYFIQKSNSDTYDQKSQPFTELKFMTKAIDVGGILITLKDFVNVNAYGTIAKGYKPGVTVPIIDISGNGQDYGGLNLKIGYRIFEDNDGDGYGNSDIGKSKVTFSNPIPNPVSGFTHKKGDCDDDSNGDPNGCPIVPANCNELTSKCAICINTGAIEYCDGVDNDCDNSLNDDVALKPNCNDPNLLYECGVHSTCQGSYYLDCNTPETSDLDHCNSLYQNKDVCSKGQCVSLSGGQQSCAVSNDVFTPACGEDGDGDNDDCDPYENMLTCPKDCTTCPIQQDCTTPDNDNDGLSDDYEDYLNTSMG
ncbi:MAG: hypothetical protein KKD75_03355, partial [Nanoarchaeota archaeon]|nr:hypothetical protein [Nanoarchaeota archaeon]